MPPSMSGEIQVVLLLLAGRTTSNNAKPMIGAVACPTRRCLTCSDSASKAVKSYRMVMVSVSERHAVLAMVGSTDEDTALVVDEDGLAAPNGVLRPFGAMAASFEIGPHGIAEAAL
jgi:hypothetical protein